MSWMRRLIGRESDSTFVEARPGLLERILDYWHGDGESGWFRRLGLLLLAPLWAIWAALDAVGTFLRFLAAEGMQGLHNRRFMHLLQGIPAFAAIVVFAVVAGLSISGRADLPGVYRRAAGAAYGTEDWKTAKLCYERLFRLDGGSAETRLLLGLTLEELGATAEAEGLIRGVAEGDAGGDPRANRWFATRLLSDKETARDPARLREALRHLTKAEQALPRDAGVKLDLARYYVATGQPRKAVPKLAVAAASDPALNFDLARLHLSLGEIDAGRAAMDRAESHFRGQLESRPDDRAARLLLANSVANLGRFDEAVALLLEGPNFDPEGPYPQALSRIYLGAYDRLAAAQPRNTRAMINALREALRHDPKSSEAAVRLAQFAQGTRTGSDLPDEGAEREAREMLEGLLAAGEAPPAVHMALGLNSWQSKDLEGARWHFERAYELDPSLAGVANNLAWVLAHQDPPELERALAVIDPVIVQFPDMPHFLDTRGEIYTRLGRWEEALHDFERALPSLRENARLHESLATVYEKLGRNAIAERHLREAERLKGESSSKRGTAAEAGTGAGVAPAAAAPE